MGRAQSFVLSPTQRAHTVLALWTIALGFGQVRVSPRQFGVPKSALCSGAGCSKSQLRTEAVDAYFGPSRAMLSTKASTNANSLGLISSDTIGILRFTGAVLLACSFLSSGANAVLSPKQNRSPALWAIKGMLGGPSSTLELNTLPTLPPDPDR